MGLNLLEKTELWVNEITLANGQSERYGGRGGGAAWSGQGKGDGSGCAARHITFDVLERNVPQAGIMGKERAILSALAALPGVCLTDKSYIHSNGILGSSVRMWRSLKPYWQSLQYDAGNSGKGVQAGNCFPTGFELKQG